MKRKKKKKKSEADPNYYNLAGAVGFGKGVTGGRAMVRKGKGQKGAPSGHPPLDVVRDEDWSSCVGWTGG